MKTEVLTVKLPGEVMADLEAFAAANFPSICPKCKGRGVLSDGTKCPACEGMIPGNKSEAARFLLHHALGQAESPEVRALIAAYSEARAKFFKVIMSTAHRMELQFHDEVISAVREIQASPASPRARRR